MIKPVQSTKIISTDLLYEFQYYIYQFRYIRSMVKYFYDFCQCCFFLWQFLKSESITDNKTNDISIVKNFSNKPVSNYK